MKEDKKILVYVLSKFPKLSETFIFRELVAHRKAGYDVRIFSLLRPTEAIRHPGQEELVEATTYVQSLFSPGLWLAHLKMLCRHPLKYFGNFFTLMGEAFPKPKLIAEVVYVFAVSIPWCDKVGKLGAAHIHAHFAGASTTAAQIISSINRIPYSITAHANDIFVDAYGLKRKIDESVFTATVTSYNYDYLMKLCPDKKDDIHVIPTALDLEEFPFEPERKEGQTTTIMAVGRLMEKKGFEYLIKALHILKGKGYSFHCNIIGDGPLEGDLRKLIDDLDVGGMISLAGAKSMPEIIEGYGSSDIFVLPCVISSDGDRDGLPHTIIESMACGLPTVSTDILGIAELIRHHENGMLARQRDAENLADILIELIGNSELKRKLGAAARQTISNEYDVNKTAAKLRHLMNIE